MKRTIIALFIIALAPFAYKAGVGKIFYTQAKITFPRFAQPVNLLSGRLLALNPTRNLRGGSPPNPTMNFWDGFSGIPARSLWGGFPLNTDLAVTTTQSSSDQPSFVSFSLPPSCESADEFCTIQPHFFFQRPFSSTFNTAIELSYLYGTTLFGSLDPHHGVEFLNPTGTPVLAVEDGIVVVAGTDAHQEYGPWENFYGNLVVIEHRLPGMDEPVYTLYGHLSAINVQLRQEVKVGELIGEVGTSGRAMGSHLHFEVRVGENLYANASNPALWLFPESDENGKHYGALAGKLDNPEGDPMYATIKVEYYADINGLPQKTFSTETYATEIDPMKSDEIYQENFALTDLPPGHYRIVTSTSGEGNEHWVDVEPGKLTFVTIVSK